jgi:hypothetical protein
MHEGRLTFEFSGNVGECYFRKKYVRWKIINKYKNENIQKENMK